jgi:uncharacterized protein (DUF58 family)
MKRSSVAFVLSDFQTDEDFANALKITKKRHDLIAIQISDRAESDLPNLGLVDVENLESGSSAWLWLGSRKTRQQIAESMKKEQANIEEQLHKSRVDFTRLFTNEPIVKPLIHLFQSRHKK